MFAVAGCSVPDSYERHGNFQVEFYRTDALGHTSTRRAVSHLNGSRNTRVTDAAVSFTIAPFDQDRIIYDTCDLNPGCRHMYFDGHTGKTHEIGRGLKVSMSALDESERWSWNGNYVAIGDQYELVVVDLQTGLSTRLAGTLQLNEPFYPDKWQHREVRWGKWAPDGMHASLFVLSPHGPGLPVLEWDEELYSLDGSTGMLSLVATHTGNAGIRGPGGLWLPDDLRWDGATLQPSR